MNLDNDIITKYGHFFKFKDDSQKSCMKYGIQCDGGWKDLIVETLELIDQDEYSEFIEITQIKEKFSVLRISYTTRREFKLKFAGNIFRRLYYKFKGISYDSEKEKLWTRISKIINDASIKSGRICEVCGKQNAERAYSDYWIKTVCESCRITFDNFTYKR